jgi:hypothetical protein
MSASIELGWNNGKLQAGAAGAAAIVDKASRQMKGALSGIGSGLGGSLGITPFLGIAGAVGGAVVAIKSLAQEYDHIWDLSQRLNESPESIQRIGLQAKLAGSDVDTAAKAIQKMNLELRKGAGSEGVKALKAIGMDAADLLKLSPEKQIAALAAAFQKAQASGAGFAEINSLLGKKFNELLPLLRSSVEDLDAFSKLNVVSNEDVARIAAGADAFDVMFHNIKVGAAMTMSTWADWWEMAHKGIRVFNEDKRAAENLNEVLRQQQRDLDAVAAAQSAANDEANESIKKSKEQASAIDKVSKAYEAQAGKINAARDAWRNAHDETSNEGRTSQERLDAAKAKIADIDKQLNATSGQIGGEEITYKLQEEREKVMRSILQISKEIVAEQEQANQEAADAAKALADQKSAYQTNLDLLDLELAILNAQASGHDKKAKQLEHERDVQEETARIVADTGLAYADAAKKAEQLVSAKERVDGRKDGSGRRKIRGYSQQQDSEGIEEWGMQNSIMTPLDGKGKQRHGTNRSTTREAVWKSMFSPSGERMGDIGAKTPATDAPKASGESEIAAVIKGYTEQTIEIFKQALA